MKIFGTSRQVLSWALYDWANSTYSVAVISGFFPVFFKQYWSLGADSTVTTARLGTLISAAGLFVALISPFLGALADLRGRKKLFTFLFMVLGAASSAGLAWVGPGRWMWAAILYMIGTVGFTASSTFYDSLLPSIAPAKDADHASSVGFALGYLGGGVFFAFCVLMYLKPELFSLADGVAAIKLTFVLVAVWWLGFSIPLFRDVPEPRTLHDPLNWGQALRNSGSQLKKTMVEMCKDRNLLLFMMAFWLYIDGVYTVINMAVDLGISLGFEAATMITALLVVQFIAFPFALLFSKFATRWGAKTPILICIGVYALVVFGAAAMTKPWHLFTLAAVIGMVLGGVQALSRSLFSRMIPIEKSGEYFGFFNLVGKFAAVLGPLMIGWGTLVFGDHRKGLLVILILFAAGAFLLMKVKEPGRI